MANASYIQTSFQSGEWSQTMQGRMDRPDYRQAMARCFNSLPIETEAWTRRPGFQQVGLTRGGVAGRLIRFEFQESNPYNMEFTDGHVRWWAGADIATTNDDQSVVSISGASPALVMTGTAHGWATADQVVFKSLGVGAAVLQGRVLKITVASPTTFSLADAITGAAIDGSLITGFVSGTVARVLDVATPYTAGGWQSLRSIQATREAVLLNGTAPQLLTQVTDSGPLAFASFALAPVNFKDGPYLDPYSGSIATPSAKVGNITLTFAFQAYDATVSYSIGDYASSGGHNYKSLQNANLNNTQSSSPTYWQEVTGGDPISSTGFTAADIGRHIRLFSEPALWVAGTPYAAKDVVAYNLVYWISLASSNTGVIPGTDATKWAVVAGQQYAIWSWGRITALSGAGVISGALAGSLNIGSSWPFGGTISAAFDGSNAKGYSACAIGNGAHAASQTSYVGKNYSGASAQTIAQVTVYPSTDFKFCSNVSPTTPHTLTINLRAKATAPASASDGTLLGTSGPFADTFSSVTVISSDTTTAWNFVWVEIIVTTAAPADVQTAVAQVVFFTPNAATGSVVTLQIAGPPLLYTSAIRIWRAGAFSNAAGWPKCGTYDKGRMWLSGAVANRFDGSKPNDIFNFAPTEPDGTVTDANAISYTLNAPDVNAIFWLAPHPQGLIAGTQGGEWLIQAAAANSPLTPTSIRADKVTTIKCANIEPAQCEHTLVLVQKHKRRLMEYFADIFSGKFASPNLTYKAQHITKPGIAEIRYQQDTMPVVWTRLADNTLAGLTYKRDSLISKDGPTISGAHRHTHGANRTVESLAVGPAGDGGELEALSAITTDGTYRYVEIMGQVFGEEDDLSSAQYLDGAIAASSYQDLDTALKVNGLWALNGKTVRVSVGGLDGGSAVVANGSAILTYGDGIENLFTSDYVASFNGACPIFAGFAYTSQAQLLRPNAPIESGARQGPGFGKTRRSHRVVASIVNALSGAVSFGTVFTKLQPALFKVRNGARLSQADLFTGIYKETLQDGGEPLDSMLCWEVTGISPATIAAAGAFLNTEDE